MEGMDLSGVNDIDAVAIYNLENIMDNYRQRDTHFAFTGMKGPWE
jgi:anti-anti-sigma regulatory factor